MNTPASTFFFYDLETSGLSPQHDRIMQFAGQRTDFQLNPIGEPYNLLVALNDDVLPSPEALFVTGITPQKTREEGYTEAQFAKILAEEIFTPGTVAVGFNNIRFDDEFVRHIFWRTFFEPYEWTWKDGRSRWDLLDVVRMTRALRPTGIRWPTDAEGKATNRLELLTKENNIAHESAHDALSDVTALIAITKLIKNTQPNLYEYLFSLREKNAVKKLVNLDEKKPFVYTSGRYDAEFQKTTVAFPLTSAPNGNVLVYDLRYDPSAIITLSVQELRDRIFASREDRAKPDFIKIPVKALQFNRAPAVAPLGVLQSEDGWKNISLEPQTVARHQALLLQYPDFAEKIRDIFENKPEFEKSSNPEGKLYDGFVGDRDKIRIEAVRNASARELADFHPEFSDERLSELLLHYKARNFPKSLSDTESKKWQEWRAKQLAQATPTFLKALEKAAREKTEKNDLFIIEELRLWLENITPEASQKDEDLSL